MSNTYIQYHPPLKLFSGHLSIGEVLLWGSCILSTVIYATYLGYCNIKKLNAFLFTKAKEVTKDEVTKEKGTKGKGTKERDTKERGSKEENDKEETLKILALI